MRNGSNFFSNRDCEHFPCHDAPAPDDFNCLFCFCPLYSLGEQCGGDFEITKKGVKSCIACSIPHRPEQYDAIMARLKQK